MYKYKYLIFLDFDEYIIPKLTGIDTLQQLLDKINEKNKGQTYGSYNFKPVFFYNSYENDPDVKNPPLELRVHLRTEKSKYFFDHHVRSKYIANPRMIIEAGNHFIWTYQSGREYQAELEEGFVHHYRDYDSGIEGGNIKPGERDRSAHKYVPKLTEEVENALKQIEHCH